MDEFIDGPEVPKSTLEVLCEMLRKSEIFDFRVETLENGTNVIKFESDDRKELKEFLLKDTIFKKRKKLK